MIFIATCSQDTTTDLVIKELDTKDVLRFNIDRPDDFVWDFHQFGFRIADKVSGREISDRTLSSFYLRKPIYFDRIDIPKNGCVENWVREETDELFQDFYRECQARGLTALVRSQNNKFGKLRQMLTARDYFHVAPWHFFHGELPSELHKSEWVVKSMTATPLSENKAFFVRSVDPVALDLSYPWFIQERIDGELEVTVVFIDGETYAACTPRKDFGCEDSRKALFKAPTQWPKCELARSEIAAIKGFMEETGYRFGRFDFIRKDGELWFLELNPNGQWAWLDQDNENGLITMVAETIMREDRHRGTDYISTLHGRR